MSERKELTPNGAAVFLVGGGTHRKQPRAGAGRAISFGDGISNGWVDVYVRCCSFLLKRTPAAAVREGSGDVEGMEDFSGFGRSDTAGRALEVELGAKASSDARAVAGSADSSGAKRFAWCSGATLLLRVVRCDAMCG